MKNILVTGGAGFIGANFIHFLQKQQSDYLIINLDKLTYAGNLDNLSGLPAPENHIFIEGDILDSDLVKTLLRKYDIDTVVHFAAESHVDRSIHGPSQFIQTNINGTFSLLEEARHYWLANENISLEEKRFHHISTDEVYGSLSPSDPPFNENTPYAPNSPYSASKASSDHLVQAYHHTYGLPITISNCSNNYGPYQFPEKLIPVIILNALNGKALPIYGDGQQIRDWLYVEDHCDAIYQILTKGKIGATYNIGGNNQPSNLQIVRLLCEILDQLYPSSPFTPHDRLIKYVKDRPGHDRRYAMDIQKISRELDWSPKYSLEDGLLKTAHWYIDNHDWLDGINNRMDYQSWLITNYQNRKGSEK